MTVSLIITTYNWPKALTLCLESVMRQIVMPTEIIIADDGSGDETRAVIKRFQEISPVPIRHVWQEDKGYRLSMIRNKAIATSHCDYIIQIDGDLILHRKFVQDHIACAKKGHFVTGSRGILSEHLSKEVINGEVSPAPFVKGVKNSFNTLRLPFISFLYCTLGPKRFIKGCNMAFWREDLIKINGYDESFVGWGREDTELAVRLENNNIKQRCMKFRGIVFHIYHGKRDRQGLEDNDRLYQQSIQERRTRCAVGLDKHL